MVLHLNRDLVLLALISYRELQHDQQKGNYRTSVEPRQGGFPALQIGTRSSGTMNWIPGTC